MTTQITGSLLRERVRTHRESHPDRPFTTIEKILIAAEVVKREHHRRGTKNPQMNDADLIHACLELFPEYDGRDRDLYLRGKASATPPIVRPTLIRDHLYGRSAPLKRWMSRVPKTNGSFLLTASGSIYVHKLLLNRQPRRKRTASWFAKGELGPVMAAMPTITTAPSLEQLRALRFSCWHDLRLVKSLRALDCIKRPGARMLTDGEHLLNAINEHRQPSDPPILDYIVQAIERAKTLAQAEALFDGTPAAIVAGDREMLSLDALLLLTQQVLKRSPNTRFTQRFQKTGTQPHLQANA